MSRERLVDIDRAKGLAIFLVVVGHLFVFKSVPEAHQWYANLKLVIYSFHMSFFMFVAGFVMFYTYRPVLTVTAYTSYLAKRFWRLMPAYILFGLLIFVAKLGAQEIMQVDNSLTSLSDFFNIFLYPRLSFSRFLWFIYVIFIFYAAVPPLLAISKGKQWPLFCFGLGLYFLPRTDLFAIGFIESYFVMFMLGGLLATHQAVYDQWLNKFGGLCFGLFALSLSLVVPLGIDPFPTSVDPLRLLVGFLSAPAIHWLVRLGCFSKQKVLTLWGRYTFSIYLMNTLAIGATKAIMLKITNLDRFNFVLVALCAMIAGLYGPILIKSLIFSRIPALDRITN